MEEQKTKKQPAHPRASANVFSVLTFSWTLPMFWKGRKKEIQSDDLFEPLEEHASGPLGDKFARLWDEEERRSSTSGRPPSLLRVIMKAYAAKCMLYGLVLLVMECGIRIIQPIFLGKLISHFSPEQLRERVTEEEAYVYAAAVVACSAVNVFIVHPYMMAILHMGMKFRVACCSLIYRKSLRLSKTALGETTVGQVVNLLSNDVNRFDVAIIFLHYLWIGPLATVIITVLMWREIQASAVVGVAFMLLFIPLQAYLGKRTSVLRLRTALRTDERVRLMNEIISGVQVIKMYTWERPFADLVAKARKREIKQIRANSYIRGVLFSFIMFITRICLFMSILTYVIYGGNITAERVFVTTSFYNILRQTMTVFFPQGIAQVAEASISIKRLQKFMMYSDTSKPVPGLADIQTSRKLQKDESGLTAESKLSPEEKKAKLSPEESKLSSEESKLSSEESKLSPDEKSPSEHANGNGKSVAPPSSQEDSEKEEPPHLDARRCGIQLKSACARWLDDQPEYTLHDVTLTIKPGTLTAVIGPVGAGKSSLLNVLLRELPLVDGTLNIGGDISYASQEPWLFAGSVRQNILFGQPMDRPRYNRVVRRCALDRDFQLLPNGDKTVVGERGVSLSGGQRARVSLARAVYKRADIYLLDDPLSAVDTHVGRHLFESCILKYLNNTTRILVTHQLQFLREVDHIIIIKNGTIVAEGKFDALSASGLDFASLLKEEQEEQDKSLQHQVSQETSLGEMDELSHAGSFRKRQISIHSVSSVDNLAAIAPPEGGRTENEMQSSGAVSGKVYGAYFRASGHPLLVVFVALVAVASQLLASGSDWWTNHWVTQEELLHKQHSSIEAGPHSRSEMSIGANSTGHSNSTFHFADIAYADGHTMYEYIYIYTGIILLLVFVTLARSCIFFSMAMRASTKLHNAMFSAITRAPMRFFHTNPSGRILNRFSKDMGAVDEILPAALLDVIQIGLSLLGIVGVVASVNPWLLLPTALIGLIFYLLRNFYLASSRSIKRLEGVTRSPVFSYLNASLQGITTIRAFGAQEALIREFDAHQDLHSSAWYLFIASSRAFGFWLDLVCVIYIAFVTFSFLVIGRADLGGNVGLAITQAMGLTGMFQWGMRQSTELENQMTSVERITEYVDIEPEPPLQSAPEKRPPPSWPERGRVTFRRVSLRYAPGEPPVLRDLSFDVQPQEKIGIVGRTGAGKSSLINALFRLAYIDGSIMIDERETSELGLHELRSQISIIPQEPVLFSGTMRHNLDPFDEYPDSVLWKALEEVELKEAVMELTAGLNSKMSEGGSNFSVGQRQLVCLARAIVRRNRILVLDEATANVDPQTDALIQTTIRNKFSKCTVLTIAHRLHTVMDSDKVLVMEAGQAVEFEHPHVLLQKEDGKLRAMVEQTGRGMAEALIAYAKQSYDKTRNNQQLP